VPLFRAVSYTWMESKYDNLTINGERMSDFPGLRGKYSIRHPLWCRGRRIIISTNLRDALRRFRHATLPIRLWIDAVCINQQDLVERSQQVLLMPRIYHSALTVWLWLGEEDEDTEKALDWIDKINHAAALVEYDGEKFKLPTSDDIHNPFNINVLQIGLFPIHFPEWQSLVKLLQRPVFRRIWIVQEMITANKVIGFCGSAQFLFKAIQSAVQFIIRCCWDTELVQFYNLEQDVFPSIDCLRLLHLNWHLDRRNTRPRLILTSRNFQATDSKDKVYALMGLLNDFAHRQPCHLGLCKGHHSTTESIQENFPNIQVRRDGEGTIGLKLVSKALGELVIHYVELEHWKAEQKVMSILADDTNSQLRVIRQNLEGYIKYTYMTVLQEKDRISWTEPSTDIAIEVWAEYQQLQDNHQELTTQCVEALMRTTIALDATIPECGAVKRFVSHVVESIGKSIDRLRHFMDLRDADDRYLGELNDAERNLCSFLICFKSNTDNKSEQGTNAESREIGDSHDPEFCSITHSRSTLFQPGLFSCAYYFGVSTVACSSSDEGIFPASLDALQRSTRPPCSDCTLSRTSWHLLKAYFGDLNDWTDEGNGLYKRGDFSINDNGTAIAPLPTFLNNLDPDILEEIMNDTKTKPEVCPAYFSLNIVDPVDI
jgi:hypothetical protein